MAQWQAAQMAPQNGKVALVTGANSGIGFQTALELAHHGAHVLLGCRTEAKALGAIDRLNELVPGAGVEAAILDMANLDSIRAFAASFISSSRSLDLLINNAGVMALPQRATTADGFELQFGTNHLGHFALTGLLLPSLLRSDRPRIITVASLAHKKGKIAFEDLQSERSYSPWGAYNQSKLANLLFALELDRRAKAQYSKLISTPVHPGIARTSIFLNGPGNSDLKSKLAGLFSGIIMQPDAAGALPTLYAATYPSIRGGEYIGPNGLLEFKGSPVVVKPDARALDQTVAARLWSVSEDLCGVHYPALA